MDKIPFAKVIFGSISHNSGWYWTTHRHRTRKAHLNGLVSWNKQISSHILNMNEVRVWEGCSRSLMFACMTYPVSLSHCSVGTTDYIQVFTCALLLGASGQLITCSWRSWGPNRGSEETELLQDLPLPIRWAPSLSTFKTLLQISPGFGYGLSLAFLYFIPI